MPMNYLYMAQFMFSAGTAMYQHNQSQQEVIAKRRNAYKQASMNNNLAYIAQLHVNEEDALDLKKQGFEMNELRMSIRRETAKQAAINASIGGGAGRSGNSADAVLLNIRRHGYKALSRKDLNRETREMSFRQRRENIANEALSKNNALMSGVPTAPSDTGLALQIAGSGVQSLIGSQKGTKGS